MTASRVSERPAELVDLNMDATPSLWWAAYLACKTALASDLEPPHRRSVEQLAGQVDLHYRLIGAYGENMSALIGDGDA